MREALLCPGKSRAKPAAFLRVGLLVILLSVAALTSGQDVTCPTGWVSETFDGVMYCYTLKQTNRNYDAARTDCLDNGARLLWIDSAEENTFINTTYGSVSSAFWIGLNDQANEGTFVWSNGDSPSYYIVESSNNQAGRDCVVFSKGNWTIVEGCSNEFRQYACKSSNNAEAIGNVATEAAGLDSGVIVVIVIVALVIVGLLVLGVVLVILWKYCNDTFNTYVCPCFDRKTKHKVHVLEQENQKLRTELAQFKMNQVGVKQSMSRDSFDVAAVGSSPSSPMGSPRPSIFMAQRSPSIVGPNQPPPLQRTLPSTNAPSGYPRQQSLSNVLNRSGGQGQIPRLSLPSPPNAARFTLPAANTVKEPLPEDSAEEEEEEEDSNRKTEKPPDSPV